jgi:predicted Rossmann fold flavoprotein
MPSASYDLIVVGGGAAGFFGAINAAEFNPKLKILIIEKTTKLLTKVKISGGGRCNVTHHSFSPAALSQHYPRGQRPLKNIFHQFQVTDTVGWFEKRGVKLKTEEDGRMFPETDESQTIIDCFLREAARLNIEIRTGTEILRLEKKDRWFVAYSAKQQFSTAKVLVAMGGHNKPEAYHWLQELGHEIINPIPSLFTFNDSQKEFVDLMGVAVPQGEVRIAGTKFSQRGAVLITHWGLSGPAVIKLSAWAAEYLFQKHYLFVALVNWTGETETEIRDFFMELKTSHSAKQILTHPQFGLPKRLWEHLCEKAGIEEGKTWSEVSNKAINRLIELTYACPFQIKGKTTFKEEFVTCE